MWAYLSEPQPHHEAHRALGYPGPEWWFTLHMIQTPMVGLVAIGLWRMVADIGAGDGMAIVLAWLSRIATFVMLIYFTVLDGIGGIGLGRSILKAKAMAASAYSSCQGKAEAMASLIRRQLIRTSAPIFRRRSRMVPLVAAANWVWRRPIRRSAQSRT